MLNTQLTLTLTAEHNTSSKYHQNIENKVFLFLYPMTMNEDIQSFHTSVHTHVTISHTCSNAFMLAPDRLLIYRTWSVN